MNSALHKFRPALRALTILVGAVQAVAFVLGALHSAAAEHVRCVEHGEFVHAHDEHDHAGDAGERADAVPAVDDETESEEAQLAPGEPPVPPHEHMHCDGALARHDGDDSQLTATATTQVLPPENGVLETALAPRAPPSVRLLALARAPKTGPPATV